MADTLPAAQTADTTLAPSLLSISKSVRALQGMRLAKLGFYSGQDGLLMIADTKGASVSSIADRLSIRPSTVSKMMDRLVEKGLVERTGDIKDARRTLVRITPAGIEAREQIIQFQQELERELSKALGNDGPAMATCLAECARMLDVHLRRLR